MRRRRQEPARELVRSLGAALEARNATLDAELDALVIACLEMHAGDVVDRTPVASPHRFAGVDIERCAHRLVVMGADDEQQMFRHCPGKLVKELAREIWRRMVSPVGAFVAAEE